jgi:putative transposase
MRKTTTYDPCIHGRHSIRLAGYDYAAEGFYFVTICTQDRKRLFGRIRNGEMELNGLGRIAREELLKTPSLRPNVRVDAWVVMPDHVHVIFEIKCDANHINGPFAFMANDGGMANNIVMAPVGATRRVAPTRHNPTGPLNHSIGTIVGQFKSIVTKRVRIITGSDIQIWQRNFHDRIIRDQEELEYYREYIRDNPKRWEEKRNGMT